MALRGCPGATRSSKPHGVPKGLGHAPILTRSGPQCESAPSYGAVAPFWNNPATFHAI